MRHLFRQFSFPGGIGSHVTPETPGSIHEGGELGYALVHAFGAAFDNPDLVVFCVVGDGEAETGPLAASWHSNKFLNPAVDGTVVPILALNGYKIANPTILDRIGDDELHPPASRATATHPVSSAGDDPMTVHAAMADDDGRGHGRRSRRSRPRPRAGSDRAPDLADDRPAHAEGLDRSEGRRRQADRGHVALAPGPALRRPRQPGAPRPARGVAALLSARRAVRRRRPA